MNGQKISRREEKIKTQKLYQITNYNKALSSKVRLYWNSNIQTYQCNRIKCFVIDMNLYWDL